MKIKGFIWPMEVHVVTMEYLTGLPGCDTENYPQSAMLWMQAEIRNPTSTIYGISLFIEIWTDRYVKIFAELKRRKFKYEVCDAYNAAWASFGYTENQCPKALRIMQFVKRF